jgi:lipopolysaccharide exporter
VRTAAMWVAASLLVAYALMLVRSVIAARLLSPDDFGLYSMALTAVLAFSALTSVSLDHAITASNVDAGDERVRAQLDAMWTAELFRRLVLTLLLAGLVYPLARFYGRAELILILPCAALVPLMQGLQNVGLALLRNRISFARLFWHETASVAVWTIVSTGLALVLRNFWALVVGQLAGAAAGTTISYLLHPYRPRLAFDREVLRQAFHFGKYATVIGVLSYVTTTADNVVIGRLFGAGVLGVYAVAYGLASLPATVVMGAVGRATFPAYAVLAAQGLQRVGQAFIRSLAAGSVLLTLITVPLLLLAPEVISVLYGRKWEAAGGVLRVLSLVGLARGLVVIISWLHMGLGRAREVTRGKIVEAAIFLALLLPLTSRYGMTGAAYAGVIAYTVGLCERLLSVRRLLPLLFGRAVLVVLASLASGVCGAGGGWLVLRVVEGNWPRLVLGGAVSTASTALLLFGLTPGLRAEVRASLRSLRARRTF